MALPGKTSVLDFEYSRDGKPFAKVTAKPSIETLSLDISSNGMPFVAVPDTGTVPRIGTVGQPTGYVQLPGTDGSIITLRPWSSFKNFIFPALGGIGSWTVRWWLKLPRGPVFPGRVFLVESGDSSISIDVTGVGEWLVAVTDGVGTAEVVVPPAQLEWTAVTVSHDQATNTLIVTTSDGYTVSIDTSTLTVATGNAELTITFGPINGGFTQIVILDEPMTPEDAAVIDALGPSGDITPYVDPEGHWIAPVEPATPEGDTPRSLIPTSGSTPDEPLYVLGPFTFESFGDTVVVVIPDSSQFLSAYQELLPPGPIWETDDDPKLFSLMEALSQEGMRIYEQAGKLVTEGNPITTVELVPEWEVVFGLPDRCAPPPTTLDARQAAIAAAFLAAGGQSVGYYLGLLRTIFGVNAVIEENWPSLPFVTGDGATESGSETGDSLGSVASSLSWRLTMLGSEVKTQENADRIECLMNRIKPSHTRVVFNYVGANDLYPDVDTVYVTSGAGQMTGTSPLPVAAASFFGVWLLISAADEGEVVVQIGSVALRVSASGSGCIVNLDYGYANDRIVELDTWHWCLLTYKSGTLNFYLNNELWSSRTGVDLSGTVTLFGGNMPYKATNIVGGARDIAWNEKSNLYAAGRKHDVRNATGMSWVGESLALQWVDPDSGGSVTNVGTGGTHNLVLSGDVTSEET